MTERKHQRYDLFGKVSWDFYANGTGKKIGYLGNLSISGCLLKTSEPIENRRWVRLIIEDAHKNMSVVVIGRVVRQKNSMEIVQGGGDFTLYHYGIEFTSPNYFSLAGTTFILDLSKTNLSVRSCLNRNSRSPFLPGFLA